MNTKFPLNGRYTMLGDLVHEYGSISTWPKNMVPDDDLLTMIQHNGSDVAPLGPGNQTIMGRNLYGADPIPQVTNSGTAISNYWDPDKAQPFIRLIYDLLSRSFFKMWIRAFINSFSYFKLIAIVLL